MELLPQEIAKTLPPLRGQENSDDPIMYVKFYHPLSRWAWYASEFSPEEGIFFGWVYGDFPELGYFSLEEMMEINIMGLGMERDLYFQPTTLSEVKKRHGL